MGVGCMNEFNIKAMKKLFNNVHRDGNDIYSYVTKVAVIEGNNLVMLGTFSQTTSKQMTKVAELYGLKVVKSKERPDFEMLHYGANVKL